MIKLLLRMALFYIGVFALGMLNFFSVGGLLLMAVTEGNMPILGIIVGTISLAIVLALTYFFIKIAFDDLDVPHMTAIFLIPYLIAVTVQIAYSLLSYATYYCGFDFAADFLDRFNTVYGMIAAGILPTAYSAVNFSQFFGNEGFITIILTAIHIAEIVWLIKRAKKS